ncbi:MAG: M67 family metallopeptidase [Dehalococcoidia bacterium]
MEIPKQFTDAMVQHAMEEDPNECCGLLAGKDGRVLRHYRVANAEKSPYRYSMDGKELLTAYNEIEDDGMDIQVIYHSHTHSPAYPSNTDIRLATWPDAYYLLVSLMDKENPDIRVFRIVDGQVTEEPVLIT